MNTGNGLIELLGQVKRQLTDGREIGLDPPFISTESQDFLSRGFRFETPVNTAESQDFPRKDVTSETNKLKKQTDFKSLKELELFIGNCNRCKLSKGRKNIVFGEGPVDARLVFVGEAPGADEDLSGKPFVGRAGKLLTGIINAMGLTRDDVYICNIAKCHPPDNRDPEIDEIKTCIPFLRSQISLIKPEVICSLGRVSAQNLIKKDFKITRERGHWYKFLDIPLMPTFHPAYLLRSPEHKREVWEDIKKIMKKLGLKDPRKEEK